MKIKIFRTMFLVILTVSLVTSVTLVNAESNAQPNPIGPDGWYLAHEISISSDYVSHLNGSAISDSDETLYINGRNGGVLRIDTSLIGPGYTPDYENDSTQLEVCQGADSLGESLLSPDGKTLVEIDESASVYFLDTESFPVWDPSDRVPSSLQCKYQWAFRMGITHDSLWGITAGTSGWPPGYVRFYDVQSKSHLANLDIQMGTSVHIIGVPPGGVSPDGAPYPDHKQAYVFSFNSGSPGGPYDSDIYVIDYEHLYDSSKPLPHIARTIDVDSPVEYKDLVNIEMDLNVSRDRAYISYSDGILVLDLDFPNNQGNEIVDVWPTAGYIRDLEFNYANDTLYGIDNTSLYIIDPETGNVSNPWPIPGAVNLRYMTSSNDGTRIYIPDITTGKVYVLEQIQFGPSCELTTERVFCDNFNDGDFTNNPTWSADQATGDASFGYLLSHGADLDGSDRYLAEFNARNLSIQAPGYLEFSYRGLLLADGEPGVIQNGRGIILAIVGPQGRYDLNIQNGYTSGFPTDQNAFSIVKAPAGGSPTNLVTSNTGQFPIAPPEDGEYYHVRAVRENGEWSLYVNGNLVGYAPEPFPFTEITQVHLPTVGSIAIDDIEIIAIANSSPIVYAGDQYVGTEGTPITLSEATASDPDQDPLTYSWSVDNPLLCSFDNSSLLNPNLTCSDNGTYMVTLTVDDGVNEPVSDNATVTVSNVAPTATFGNDGPVDEGSSFMLSLTDPFDPSSVDTAAGFEYAFDCGDGNGYGDYSASNNMSCPTVDNKTHSVAGKIRDKDGDETPYTASVDVYNVAPTVTLTGATQAFEYDTKRYSYTTSDPGTADTFTLDSESCGSGGALSSATFDANTGEGSFDCTFANGPQTTTVSVTLSDDDGGSGSDSLGATVLHGFLRFCIFANQDVIQIEESVQVVCGVGGKGLIELKKDVVVEGDVAGHDDIKLEENSYVGGNAIAAGEVILSSGASVAGTIAESADLPSVTQVEVNVDAGGSRVKVKKGKTKDLAPGRYGKLIVKEDGTLNLSVGAYAFTEVKVEKNATINFTPSGGDTVLSVAGKVDLEELVMMNGTASAILIQVGGGDVKLGKAGIFLGTFVAPDAHIDMLEDATLTGGLYGQKVQVKKNATVLPAPAIELFIQLYVQ